MWRSVHGVFKVNSIPVQLQASVWVTHLGYDRLLCRISEILWYTQAGPRASSNWASIHSADGSLTARTREVSKSWNSGLDSSSHSVIWQTPLQHRCIYARCLSNVRGIRSLQHPISQLRDFRRNYDETSIRLVNGHLEVYAHLYSEVAQAKYAPGCCITPIWCSNDEDQRVPRFFAYICTAIWLYFVKTGFCIHYCSEPAIWNEISKSYE